MDFIISLPDDATDVEALNTIIREHVHKECVVRAMSDPLIPQPKSTTKFYFALVDDNTETIEMRQQLGYQSANFTLYITTDEALPYLADHYEEDAEYIGAALIAAGINADEVMESTWEVYGPLDKGIVFQRLQMLPQFHHDQAFQTFMESTVN